MRFQAESWLRAHSALCSLQPLQSGMEVPLQPPNLLQKPAKPVRPQWLQTPGSQVRALECRRAAIQMSSTSLTGSPLSSARSGPKGLRLAAPGPACFPARFAPDGWAALWLPGPARSSGWCWRWRGRSPPPLTTPPPDPRSLLSPSLESRSLTASGPQRPPGRSPAECPPVCLSAVHS